MDVHLKRCHFCDRWYRPDPRTRDKQKACFRRRCRSKRKRQSHQQWLRANPDHFKDQYARTKLWLDAHPGYLAGYRADNPDYVAADNLERCERKKRELKKADIQDAIPRREIARLRTIQGADIQDTIRLRLDGLISALAHGPRADMQDAIALVRPLA